MPYSESCRSARVGAKSNTKQTGLNTSSSFGLSPLGFFMDHGDCTRTVVHGQVIDELSQMHSAVAEAKAAGVAAVRAGVTGQQVHEATTAVIRQRGYAIGLPSEDAPAGYCAMVHGTGHGVGLEVHEPPLLDFGGPEIVSGDALTVEPGLYCKQLGGIRLEDLVIATDDGCINLNRLHEELTWR